MGKSFPHTRSRGAALAVLLLAAALLTIDLGGLWQAVPALSSDLRADSTALLWINDGYGLATATTMIMMGSLADRWGARRILIAGAAGFLLASLIAAFAPTPLVLIGARLMLGVAGAAIIPAALAVIAQLFPEERMRARAISLWVAALSAGVAIGPVLGGLLLQWWWWGAVFLLAVPIMAAVIGAIIVLVPASSPVNDRRIDVVSVALFVAAMFGIVWGIKQLGAHGFMWDGVLLTIGGLVGLVVFARRQRNLRDPLVDLALFRARRFRVAIALLFTALMAMNGVNYLMPTVLQSVVGLKPLEAGLWLVPPAIGLVVGAQLTPTLSNRVGPGIAVLAGSTVATLGFILIIIGLGSEGSATGLAASLTLTMLGLAPMTVLGITIAVDSATTDRAGRASAISQTSYELGLVFGIAVTGSIAAAAYRSSFVSSAPGELPTATRGAIANSLGGGFQTARAIDGELGHRTQDAVMDALVSGVSLAAAVSAGLAVLLGVVASITLRRRP
jgi:DHA2 family multidrug resistance protein-like MFS transporter